MNTRKYLDRIEYTKPVVVCRQVLFGLHRQHLLTVPFENLDIKNKIPIRLNPDDLYQKIVLTKRGGCCYELNGSFYELLVELGFRAKRVSARVYQAGDSYSPEFDHMAIIVSVDDRDYLVDVGFGDFVLDPVEISIGEHQMDSTGEYVIDRHCDEYLRIDKIMDGSPVPQYLFRNRGEPLGSFVERCRFHQSHMSPQAKRGKLVSLATDKGRITLTSDRLVTTTGGAVEEVFFPPHDFNKRLREIFAIGIGRQDPR